MRPIAATSSLAQYSASDCPVGADERLVEVIIATGRMVSTSRRLAEKSLFRHLLEIQWPISRIGRQSMLDRRFEFLVHVIKQRQAGERG
jgi:hypothetical protein